mmetsp:Transcript_1599/g.4471  ORF Transcript_1599/g.4471 Transcript_1599/m.4471 type:complete len:206 (-) Transcript_1599:77-694(-)
MPGKSNRVRSGTSGERNLITTAAVVENAPPSRSHNLAVNFSITSATSSAFSNLIGAAPSLGSTQALAVQAAPGGARLMINCVAHRVTSPVPRGKGTPEMASNTDDLPALWSPMTAIWGSGKSCWTPWDRSVSIKSMSGRAASLRVSVFILLGLGGSAMAALCGAALSDPSSYVARRARRTLSDPRALVSTAASGGGRWRLPQATL